MNRTRAIALALAGAVSSGHVVALVHQQRHAHVTCEHGDVLHTQVAAASTVSDERSVRAAADEEAEHAHGCVVLVHTRTPSRALETAGASAVAPAGVTLVRPAPDPFRPRSWLIRLAPARSPPA
jgi:hypothetical protein